MKKLDLDINVSTVGKDDYPELEGKIITYDADYDNVYSGIVIGCNRSVGVTIVDANDKNTYLLCITGEVVPGGSNIAYRDNAMEIFDYVIEGIQDGLIKATVLNKLLGRMSETGTCNGASCAYSM